MGIRNFHTLNEVCSVKKQPGLGGSSQFLVAGSQGFISNHAFVLWSWAHVT